MLDQNQINTFVKKAKSAGFSDLQIQAEIARKKKESESPATTTPPPATTAPQMPLESEVTTPPAPQTVEREKPTGIMGAFDTASNFLFPRVNKFMRKVVGSASMGDQLDTIKESNQDLQNQSIELARKAREEKDPKKKALMLKQSREFADRSSQNIEDIIGGFEKSTGLSRDAKELQGSGKTFLGVPQEYITEGLGVGGEVGSFFVPATKAAKGAGFLGKVGAGATTGAKVGLTQGLTSPDIEFEDLGGRLKKGLVDAGLGALVGGVFTGAYELPKEVIKKSLAGAPNIIRGVFRIAPSEMRKFRKVNGMDFGEEILARDGKSIAGKTYEEIADYMATKKDKAQEVVAEALKGSKEAVKTSEVIKAIDKKIADLAPEKGNVNTEGAISSLTTIKETLAKNPKELTLEIANNIKKQLQEAGSTAFSPTGKPTPASEAFAEVSQVVREMIEKKAPGTKEGNQLIQLYHLAGESILKQGDAAANKVASGNLQKFIQNIPAIAGAGAGFMVGGVPGSVAGIVGGQFISGLQGTMRNKLLSPEVQTRLASAIQTGLKGIKNPTVQQIEKITNQVVQEAIKQITRSQTSGISGTTEPIEEGQSQQLPTDNQNQQQNELKHEPILPQTLESDQMPLGTKTTKKTADTDTATGHTVAEHLRALSKATAKGDKKGTAYIMKQLEIEQTYQKTGSAKGKAVPATQAQYLSDYDAAISVMDEVDTVLKENQKVFDPIGGRVRGANPYDTEAQQTRAIVERASQVVGKALEGGVLRKEDEEKYRKQLPNINDSFAVAKSKAKKIRDMLVKNRQQRVDALKRAGYNPEMIDFSQGTTGVTFDNPSEY